MKCDVEWPYPGFRRGQEEVAGEVAKAVKEGTVISVAAPTGFGKTPSALYGALCGGADRILYVVRTVNEIDPVLRELSRLSVEHTFLYSARRMCPLLGDKALGLTSEEFWAACRLARLQGACPYYARLDDTPSELVARILSSGGGGSRKTVASLVKELSVCPFFALRGLVDGAKVVVATYPYLFRRDIFESTFEPYDYSDFVVIVDEAHSLMNVHSLYERRLKKKDIERALGEAKEYLPKAGALHDVLRRLLGVVESLERSVRRAERLDKDIIEEVFAEFDMIQSAAEEVNRRKVEDALLSGSSHAPRSFLARLASWLATLAMPHSFLFAEKTEDGEIVLVATPMDPAAVVKEPLERARAAILLSGTLPRGDYVRELLGVERPIEYIDTELMFGPFIPPSNIYVAIGKSVTTRYRERSPAMFRSIAVYVSLISRLMPGAKLAVYPSYDLMKAVVDKMPAGLPMVIENKSTSLSDVHNRLTGEPDLLINAVADGKLVEGVEFLIDGVNLLTTVIIVGIPFPQPDIYTGTRLDVLSERLGQARANYYVYLFSAMVKVRQALGRATRSPEDRAAYFLLDYRYLRRDIRSQLRLPVKRVFSSVEGLRLAIGEARKVVVRRREPYSSSSRNDSIAS